MGKYHNLTWIIKTDFTTYLNLNRFYGMQDIDMIGLFGARGTGKSTALAIRGCSNFEDKDEQIAIVRRYKEQTQASKDYFNKVVADVHTKGICKGAYEYKVGKDTLGFGLTLSLYQNFKSGIDFSKVTTIVFEEYLKTKGSLQRYLKDIKAVLLCRMIFNRNTLNIYRDRNNCIFIEWRDKIIKDDLAYEIMKDNKYNYQYIKNFKESTLCRFIRVCYYHDDVLYNNQKAYEILEPFMELIKA